jgi:hypothetical protein
VRGSWGSNVARARTIAKPARARQGPRHCQGRRAHDTCSAPHGATWRSGDAADCKSAHPGSIPGVASTLRNSAIKSTGGTGGGQTGGTIFVPALTGGAGLMTITRDWFGFDPVVVIRWGVIALNVRIYGAAAFTWVKRWRSGHADWVRRELYRLSLIGLCAVLVLSAWVACWSYFASPAAKAKFKSDLCKPDPIFGTKRMKDCP